MIDDTGLVEFSGARVRRAAYTLAAISLAALALAACADENPSDDVIAADLSTREVLALCDELRDAVESSPRRCGSDANEEPPSNEACLNADLSGCTVTVGELRRCNERALQAPCLFVDDLLTPVTDMPSVVECERMQACYPLLPVF
jgi:hypothetical protein